MSIEEIQGYLVILTPLAMAIVAMSIFTLQDKRIKTYRLGEIIHEYLCITSASCGCCETTL
jgi:hypothetical protein